MADEAAAGSAKTASEWKTEVEALDGAIALQRNQLTTLQRDVADAVDRKRRAEAMATISARHEEETRALQDRQGSERKEVEARVSGRADIRSKRKDPVRASVRPTKKKNKRAKTANHTDEDNDDKARAEAEDAKEPGTMSAIVALTQLGEVNVDDDGNGNGKQAREQKKKEPKQRPKWCEKIQVVAARAGYDMNNSQAGSIGQALSRRYKAEFGGLDQHVGTTSARRTLYSEARREWYEGTVAELCLGIWTKKQRRSAAEAVTVAFPSSSCSSSSASSLPLGS